MARRIVAFVDVLGFKSLVESVPQPQLLEIHTDLQRAAHLQTARLPEDHRKFEEDAFYEADEIARRRVANVVMASDSIVGYSAGDTYEDALAVLSAVRGLLVAGGLTP